MELYLRRCIDVAPAHRTGKPGEAATIHALFTSLGEDVLATAADIIAHAIEGIDRASRETGLALTSVARIGTSAVPRKVKDDREEQGSPIGMP